MRLVIRPHQHHQHHQTQAIARKSVLVCVTRWKQLHVGGSSRCQREGSRSKAAATVTIRPKSNSNDFRPFGELFSRFEFEFCRRGNYSKNQFDIFCVCSGFDHMQCDCTCACVDQTDTQTTYTAQTHHTSIPTVVVSVTIHDDMHIYLYVHMHVCMCVCICVYMCVVSCFFVLSGPDRW